MNFRLSRELYDFIETFAEHWDVNTSEACRRLLVMGIESTDAQLRIDTGAGYQVNEDWKRTEEPPARTGSTQR